MPFVQRTVEPKYLSRSQKTNRICSFVDENFVVKTSASLINYCRETDTVSVNNVKEFSGKSDSIEAEVHENARTPASFSSISNNSPATSSSSEADKKTKTESGYYNSSSLCVVVAAAPQIQTKNASNHSETTMSATTKSRSTQHALNGVTSNTNNTKVITGFELESMCNITLSNVLRQCASLLVIANNMFGGLHGELQGIADRANTVKKRIQRLEENVYNFDPKLVSVRK